MSSLVPSREGSWSQLQALFTNTTATSHPLELAQQLDPSVVMPRHLEYLSIAVARCINTHRGRLIVSMPPRHGKSQTCSIWAPVWALEKNPRNEVLLASYESDFAAKWSRQVRNVLQANQASLRTRIDQGSRSAKRWNTTVGGGMVATGARGSITGRGADLLIIDDPHKNAEDSASVVRRQQVWDFYDTTARTRMSPGGSIIIIMTRWDEDDLVGRVLQEDGERWEVITFPAIAGEYDVLGRQPGEALWPERYSIEDFKEFQNSPSTWASLYQQEPTPLAHDSLAFDVDLIDSHKTRWSQRPRALGDLVTRDGRVAFKPGPGKWSIWRAPEPDRTYIIAGDPCGEGNGRDNAHAVVIDQASGEECASLHGRIGPAAFAKELIKAGYLYASEGRPALIAIEANGEGSSAVTILAEKHYPRIWKRQQFDTRSRQNSERLGWYSSSQTKNLAVSALAAGLKGEVIIHDRKVFEELKRFARTANGGYEATKGNDDTVMCWAIAAAVRKYGTALPRSMPTQSDSVPRPRDPVTGY